MKKQTLITILIGITMSIFCFIVSFTWKIETDAQIGLAFFGVCILIFIIFYTIHEVKVGTRNTNRV